MSTPLLGLALPADGTTNWGTLANTSITALLDSAVAGTTTLTSDADVTLTNTAEVANESRQAILLCSGARVALRTITAPAQSKTYVVINNTSGGFGVKLVGVGPTTGVTIAASQAALLAWNGSDFALVASTDISKLTGTLPIANGGTGQTTQQAALNALVGTQTANRVLRSDGTNSTLSQVALATDVTGTLPVANGGTGLTTYTLNGVLFANSTSSLTTNTSLTYSDDRTMRLGAAGAAYTNSWNIGYKTFIIGGQTLAGVTSSSLSHLTSNLCDTTGAGVWNYAIGPSSARGSVLTQNNGVLTWAATVSAGPAATFASPTQRISADFNGNIQFNTVGAPGVFTNHGNASITGTLDVTGAITQNSVAVVTTTGTQTLSNKTFVAPALGTPASGNLANCTFPTLNQNTTGNAASATNITGGTANQIPYNTGAGATTFIAAPTTATTFLTWNGSAFTWSNVSPSGSTFATDILVNTLTVGKGPNNPFGATTFGFQAGNSATVNNIQQTALGYRALASATTTPTTSFDYEGSTALGYKALENSNPTVFAYNTAVGAGSLKSLTTGGFHTAVGAGAARSLVGADGASTAIGAVAAERSTTGVFTAIGYGALRNSTTRSPGSTAVGVEALKNASTRAGNPAIYNENNTAVGYNTLFFLNANSTNVSGNNNTALGYLAGYDLDSGSNNTLIGANAFSSTTTVSNEITLGDSDVTALRCQVTSITSLSDQRDKYDIEDLPVGLNLINALRPRRYKWDKRDWYVEVVETVSEDGIPRKQRVPTLKDGSRAQTDWNEGFVAQEAKAALQSLGADWFPLVYESNPEKLEMSSGKLIPVLVKAIQELSARIEALEAK